MFNNLTIRSKLYSSFVFMSILAILVGAIGYLGMRTTRNVMNSMATVYLPSIEKVTRIQFLQTDIKANQYALLNTAYSVEDRKLRADIIKSRLKEMDAAIQSYDSLPKQPEDLELWKTFIVNLGKWKTQAETYSQYYTIRTSLMEQGVKNTDERCTSLDDQLFVYYNTDVITAFTLCENGVQSIVTMQSKKAIDAEVKAAATVIKSTRNLILTLIASIAFAMIIGIAISTNINNIIKFVNKQIKDVVDGVIQGKLDTRADFHKTNNDFRSITVGLNKVVDSLVEPLNVAADYISRISIGDMPPLISDKYNGDFNTIINNLNLLISTLNEIILKAKLVAEGDLMVDMKKRSEKDQLLESLTEMIKSTANIISEFSLAANSVSISSEQMSSSSKQMSQGASEQASSAEEVSSSMEEMVANIQQNTENARQTEKIALNAAEGIDKVNVASDETLKYMREIADKVSIIGEIARQTNILALNAAVEAARAGEHGKGFAVVAAEVRKLAERSQVSAVEIEKLTKNSVRATEESSKLLNAIAPEIGKTAKLVQEIAAASIEQNSGADQVNNAIQQLNHVTQQNAAVSEEMATSSEELASQAQRLLNMISFFMLESGTAEKKSVNKGNKLTGAHAKLADAENAPQFSQPKIETGKTGINLRMGKDYLDSNYERF